MKNTIKKIMVVMIFILGFSMLGNIEHTYKIKECKAVSVENGIVSIVDDEGKQWIYETNDFNINDKVVLTVHDNCTSTTKDDYIIKIKRM